MADLDVGVPFFVVAAVFLTASVLVGDGIASVSNRYAADVTDQIRFLLKESMKALGG